MAGSFEELSFSQCSRGSNFISLSTPHDGISVVENEEKLFPDTAGGFSYEIQSKITRNRRIIWKVAENVVELYESSLDFNLFGNKLVISIPGEIILPNVVINESEQSLCLFIATTKTVFQLSLVHPNHGKYGFILPSGMNVSLPSVFNDAEVKLKQNIRQFSLTQPCHQFDATATHTGDVYFGLVTDAKSLLVAKLEDTPDFCSCIELKETGVMQRLWTGLVPSFVRGDDSWMGVESLVIHSFNEDDVYAITICKDLKIRVWDIKGQNCVTTKDLIPLIPDKPDLQTDSVGLLTLKKARNQTTRQLVLAAHCCLAYNSQFIILEVFKEQKDVVLMHVSNFFSEFNNIQDLYLTNQYLWALWSTSDGEHSVSYAPVEGGKNFERGWHVAHVKRPEKNEIFIPMFQDAKEVYLENLFTPGAYNKQSIMKALQVFTKTIDIGEDFLPDETCDLPAIKESVLQILDLEIEKNMVDRELSPTEYQELQHQCWSRFYSFVQQCRQARETPLGLHVDEGCTSPIIIRQEMFGYLHCLDWVDHLYLTNLDTCEGVTSYIENELDLDDGALSRDILYVVECLKTIPEQFSQEVMLGIDKDLNGNEDVKLFLSCMASVLVTNSSDFEQLVGDPIQRGDYLCAIEARLKHIQNPQKAVETILTALEVSEFPSSTALDISEMDEPPTQNATQFLCSKDGVNMITEILSSTAFHRMHLCRDLFVLLKLMEKISCKIGLSLNVAKEFGAPISSTCYDMLRAYHAVYWSTKKVFEDIDPTTLDINLTNLAALQLTERSPASNTARKIPTDEDTEEPLSLLYCFIRDVGIQNALRYLTETNLNMLKPGDYSTLEMTKLITRACLNEIWVLNEKSSDFPEYLAAHCQYCHLNEYLHLCDEWCLVNRGTKDFLIAQSYLGSDEPHKALKYFISAARGISMQEPLLMNLLEGDEENKQESLVHYFIKVMRLFEQFEYPNFVISSASTAITIAKKNDPSVPMLWSVIFKNHMELEHYNEAYAAIIHNSDRIRRHDCLRYFIITLCERGLFQDICSYPYVNLEEEVVNIIEIRARTMDITVNKYYDLLYSYHVMKNDYRKASTTMYEQACRLCTEMHGLKSLQKQAKCYLASITALKLVDPKYSWIVRPQEKSQSVSSSRHQQQYSHSPKRKEDGEEVYHSALKRPKAHKTVIVEMDDLEKEYLLVLARLKLVQHSKNDSIAVGPGLTPAETIGLLSQTGLFDTAFSLAQKFNLSFKNIFEALAGKCANLVRSKVSEFDERWKWLTLNEINTTQLVSAKSASQQAFYLLQIYLEKYKSKNHSSHLKAVASKFLSVGCNLPSWLVKDYEFVNPPELLHLYLCYDMVLEASQLSIKYIDAVLGTGKEYLGLNTALHATTPPVWLPYTSFDQLLAALRSNFENEEIAQICEELQDKLNDYFTKVEVTSCDKLNYAQQLNSRLMIG